MKVYRINLEKRAKLNGRVQDKVEVRWVTSKMKILPYKNK